MHKREIRKARKVHHCDSCRNTIQPGQRYVSYTGIGGDFSEDRWSTFKQCPECGADVLHAVLHPYTIISNPVAVLDRMARANAFLRDMAYTNRRFFLNWEKDQPNYLAFFYMRGRELMWCDYYLRLPVHITRPERFFQEGKREKWNNCSQGGTLTKVLEELTEFILSGQPSDYIQRLLPCKMITDFDLESTSMIMRRAEALGIVKPYLLQKHPESA